MNFIAKRNVSSLEAICSRHRTTLLLSPSCASSALFIQVRLQSSNSSKKAFTPVKKVALSDIPEIPAETELEENERNMRNILDSKVFTSKLSHRPASTNKKEDPEDLKARFDAALRYTQVWWYLPKDQFIGFWVVFLTISVIYVYTEWKHGVLFWSFHTRFEE